VWAADDFLEQFLSKLQLLQRHDLVAKQQALYLPLCKESLVIGEFLVIGNLSENLLFLVKESAQSIPFLQSYGNNPSILFIMTMTIT